MHIITRLDKGGSAETVLLICRGVAENKYEMVLIYGLSQDFDKTLLSTTPLLPFTFYLLPSLVREISPVKDIIAFWKIYKIIKKEKPDIVHTHTSKAGFIGRWAAWFLRLTTYDLRLMKIIHTPHGHIFYGYYGKLKSLFFLLLERVTAKITNQLVALTEGEKNESLAFGVGRPKQWTVIHSGVEMTANRGQGAGDRLRTSLDIPEDAIVIGTVSRLEPVKGIKYFVDAVRLITKSLNRSISFLIVGDGSERKSLELRVESLEIKDKIIFTGMRNDVMDLLSIMDIYVQPSLNEGMGKTIVQAFSLGKPVVATSVQGIPYLIKDEETGLLVPPKSSEKLAEAVIRLINRREQRKKIGADAKKFVFESVDGFPRFSIERMLVLLDKLYENM